MVFVKNFKFGIIMYEKMPRLLIFQRFFFRHISKIIQPRYNRKTNLFFCLQERRKLQMPWISVFIFNVTFDRMKIYRLSPFFQAVFWDNWSFCRSISYIKEHHKSTGSHSTGSSWGSYKRIKTIHMFNEVLRRILEGEKDYFSTLSGVYLCWNTW